MKIKKVQKSQFSATTLRVILIILFVIGNGVFLGVAYTVQNNLRQTSNYRQQATTISPKERATIRKNDLIGLGDHKLLILSSVYKAPNHQETISRDLNHLAEISQLKIKNITFPKELDNSANLIGLSTLFGNYREETVSVELLESSSVESYLNFIKLLENSLPLLIPETIHMTLGTDKKIIYAPLKIGVLVDYENAQ